MILLSVFICSLLIISIYIDLNKPTELDELELQRIKIIEKKYNHDHSNIIIRQFKDQNKDWINDELLENEFEFWELRFIQCFNKSKELEDQLMLLEGQMYMMYLKWGFFKDRECLVFLKEKYGDMIFLNQKEHTNDK